MTTITLRWDEQAGRHYITGAVDEDNDYDSRSGIPASIWEEGRRLIRRALAEGVELTNRGDRYTHGEYSLVVESDK
jgi:hypothetical protein